MSSTTMPTRGYGGLFKRFFLFIWNKLYFYDSWVRIVLFNFIDLNSHDYIISVINDLKIIS